MTTTKHHARFAAEVQRIATEVSAEERRAREVLDGIERRKAKLIADGRAAYGNLVAGYREEARTALREAAKRIVAVGPAPRQPTLGDTVDVQEHVAAVAAYDAALPAHTEAMLAATRPLGAALQALDHAASLAKREQRELGIASEQDRYGQGLLSEHHLIIFGGRYRARVTDAIRTALRGELDAAEALGLAEFLELPPPEAPQAPSPTFPGGVRNPTPENHEQIARGWRTITDKVRDIL